ncbi:hypothetical protein FRC03_007123 [Tulasnella sp. 419]|nr:hypothetical protein FRC03_007123 [Tulasnella sp. 419]
MASSYPSATAERAAELAENLQQVRNCIKAATESRPTSLNGTAYPRLVAVSKLKPASDIMACYQQGQRDFGENYAAELAEKAAVLPPDIHWHFIGTLQTNKCKPLAAIPNIYAVQTLDSIKKASTLNRSIPPERTEPLNVYIQINTSGEDTKSGLPPPSSSESESSEVLDLAKFIINECPKLRLIGLMTIGSFEASTTKDEENPDFACLVRSKETLESQLIDGEHMSKASWGARAGDLELSMGMSADFEEAIKSGSGSVRVGTSIFGSRPPKQ